MTIVEVYKKLGDILEQAKGLQKSYIRKKKGHVYKSRFLHIQDSIKFFIRKIESYGENTYQKYAIYLEDGKQLSVILNCNEFSTELKALEFLYIKYPKLPVKAIMKIGLPFTTGKITGKI